MRIEELGDLCRSFSVVMIVKCGRLWWAGNVAGMGQWIWKFNIVHFLCNYITYIILNTNLLYSVLIHMPNTRDLKLHSKTISFKERLITDVLTQKNTSVSTLLYFE
jgi:hypothetical protein